MKFVIIGAGQAGATAAAKLRELQPDSQITLIGDEPAPPYQRPPLSKAYLKGELPLERMFLRPERFYSEHRIDLRTGVEVQALHTAARSVVLKDGTTLDYDAALLATGSAAIALPDAITGGLAGIFAMRGLADADRLRDRLKPGLRALVVGGGYIGLEAAAVLAAMDCRVTLVEAGPRILGRVASAPTADHIRALHAARGVDLREGEHLVRLTGRDRVERAVLGSGEELEIDIVIVGIGIRPATGLAEAAGIEVDNGIVVDDTCRTSDPHVWAAGDCAAFPFEGRRIRLESVGNAIDQAECAARNMAGETVRYAAKPWFWSDQYDMKLQIAGLSQATDQTVTRHDGDVLQSVWYLREDQLVAVDAFQAPRDYMVGKRLVEAGAKVDPDQLADPTVELKTLLKS